jgi:hypothetical protein
MRVGLAIVAIGVAQLVLAARGHADTPTKVGWWNEAQQAPAAAPTIPSPPTSTDGGITVINAPNGPAAWGAVYYSVGDIAGATLTLVSSTPITVPNGDGVLGCLVDTPGWHAGGNQRWDTKPVVDPLCTPGVVDAAGTAIAFKLSAAFRDADGAVDVAVIPTGQLPFVVNFEPPGATSLRTVPASNTPVTSDAGVTGAPTDDAVPFVPGDVVDGTTLFPDPATFAFATPPPPPPKAQNPVVALGGHPSVPQLATAAHSRSERVAVVVILVGLLYSMWRLAGKSVRPPRLLGSLGGDSDATPALSAAETPAGIGRFARPRTERPRRLF